MILFVWLLITQIKQVIRDWETLDYLKIKANKVSTKEEIEDFPKGFIPYPLALRMKALGYKEPCLAWYVSEKYGLELGKVKFDDLIKDGLLAPTWQSAFRWFRKNYNLFGEVYYDSTGGFVKGKIPNDWEPNYRWEIREPIGVRYSSNYRVTDVEGKLRRLATNRDKVRKDCYEQLSLVEVQKKLKNLKLNIILIIKKKLKEF